MSTQTTITFQKLLSQVAIRGASDLHLTVGNVPQIRVSGQLIPLEDEKVLTPDFIESIVSSVITEKERKVLEKEREVVLVYTFASNVRFKIHIFYQKNFLSLSLRFVPKEPKLLKDLGLPRVIENFIEQDKGIIIISGPYGSGRTTLVAALLQTINLKKAKRIITIEEPIEYIFTSNKSIIEQREVGRDTNSFKEGLLSLKEEDVDIVFVSEISERDVLEGMLSVAQGGKLIIAIAEGESSVKTIEKLIEMAPSSEQQRLRSGLADLLQAVLVLRLLPRIQGGEVLASEILVSSPAVASVIREGRLFQLESIIQTSRQEGMQSLDQALAKLVKNGEVKQNIALSEAQDKVNFQAMIRG